MTLLLWCWLVCSQVFAAEDRICIIVNKEAPETHLDSGKIQSIYTGHTTMWPSNEAIVLTVVEDEEIHAKFLKKYVKRDSFQFLNLWRRMSFTGRGRFPKICHSVEDVIGFVSKNRLAIGYITRDKINSKVRIVDWPSIN